MFKTLSAYTSEQKRIHGSNILNSEKMSMYISILLTYDCFRVERDLTVCATKKDSGQPAHMRSLIRVFLFRIGAPVAQWVKRWPSGLADRVRSSLEVISSQPQTEFHCTQPFIIIHTSS